MNFTETWLKTVQPKKSASRIFEKGAIKGFGIKVTPKGTISFFLCYQEQDITRYKTLGTHPIISLADAKLSALEFRGKVVDGVHREHEKIGGTLKDLCEAYLEELAVRGKRTISEVKRSFDKDVLETLDPAMLAKDVTSYQVRSLMHQCIKRGAGTQGNRLRSYLMAAFKNGISHDSDPRNMDTKVRFNLTVNPVATVPTVSSFERVGDRVLTLEELKEVWNYSGEEFSTTHLAALKLMILFGGLRSGEVTRAKLSEFNFEQGLWSIPPERTKNARWHTIPLTPTTTELVKSLIDFNPDANFLFPSRTGRDCPEHETSLAHAAVRLVDDLKMAYWTPKDLRRTCKTWAGQAGLSKEIRDRLQNHALTDVSSKHYDRYLYLREKLEALETWEKFILEAVIL